MYTKEQKSILKKMLQQRGMGKKPGMKGKGFWSNFWRGFKMPFEKAYDFIKDNKLVSTLAPLFGNKGKVIGGIGSALGFGKGAKGKPRKTRKVGKPSLIHPSKGYGSVYTPTSDSSSRARF